MSEVRTMSRSRARVLANLSIDGADINSIMAKASGVCTGCCCDPGTGNSIFKFGDGSRLIVNNVTGITVDDTHTARIFLQ
jgi:hypothetical protein